MQPFRLFIVIGAAGFVFVIAQLILEVYYNWVYLENGASQILNSNKLSHYDYERVVKEVTQPLVLWWAPLGDPSLPPSPRQCGQLSCYFTDDRRFQHHPYTKAFLFYGSSLNLTDLPLPRHSSDALWALLHEESPRNYAPLSHHAAISLFNFTSTFSRLSSYPLTTQYLSSLDVLTGTQSIHEDIFTGLKYFITTEEKNKLQREVGLAPVVYLQSDCSTPTDRDSYVVELAKYISVDSYGTCLHNKDLPPHLRPPHSLDTMMSADLLHLLGQYKFMLALENGICEDYITEKLWRPLIAGVVPIYIGSPSVTDWLPNNKSAVLVSDFDSPKDLAEHLVFLNSNGQEYNKYLEHKLESKLTNSRLIETMSRRQWDTEWPTEKGNFIETFSCFVCEKAHSANEVSVASIDHYYCPMPLSILSGAPNRSNFWLDSWFYGKCQAEVVRQFVDSGVYHFTQDEFDHDLRNRILNGDCSYSEDDAWELGLV